MPAKKTTHIKRSATDYESFVRDLRIFSLGIESSSAKIDRSGYVETIENSRAVRRLSANYALVATHRDYFDAEATFGLAVSDKDSSPSLSIECKFGAHFHIRTEPVNLAFAKRFVETEFRVMVWPYFRQFVSDMTARMTIPPIVIPLTVSED